MAIPRTLKNFTLTLDGRGYVGLIAKLELPELTLQTEEYRGGGMDVPIVLDMGQEAMEASFTLSEHNADAIKLWGLTSGPVPLTARGALQRDGEAAVPVVVNLRGTVTGLNGGEWSPGEVTEAEYTMAVRYYRYTQGGEDLIEIDAENMVRKIGGVDQLQGIREAIGL